MRFWKFAFKVSLIVNLGFAWWLLKVLSDRRIQSELLDVASRTSQENIESIKLATEKLTEISDRVNRRTLRTIASNDQLDAFLEERGIYVD